MTPYLAIIKDSFREALASRVLWIVLLLITLTLLALVPLRWTSTVGSRLDGRDIRNVSNLAPELEKGKADDATPMQKMLWESLSDDTREVFGEVKKHGARGGFRFAAKATLAADFNQLIENEDFYQPELWSDISIPPRLEELLAKDDLSPELKQHRNRLALEAALPGQIRACPDEAVKFWYAEWALNFVPPLNRSMATDQVEFVVLTLVQLVVGFFGIFAAVLVTAPIIPNMLSTGSLYALLSKPISRPMLFLAKFVGGCSFVFVNVCYLVVGIYLILGFRFQLWNPRLLWAIPIFLFTFAIFYAVSAVSGLVWRNTVVAIAMTVLFWGFCTSIGWTRGIMQQFVIVPDQIEQLVQAGDQLFVKRGNGGFGRWNEFENTISPVMASNDEAEMFMGPKGQLAGIVFDEKNEALLALERDWSQSNIISALKSNGWRRETPAPAPKNSVAIFLRDGKPTVVADFGVYEVSLAQVEEPLSDINIFGLKIPAPTPKDIHHKISEGVIRLTSDARAAYSKADDHIYILDGRTLRVLAPNNGVFEQSAMLETDFDEATHMAAADGFVVLCERKEDANTLHVLNSNDLSLQIGISPRGDDEIRDLSVSESGEWISVLTEDDKLEIFETKDGQPRPVRGSWTAATISEGKLFASNQNDKVVTRSLSDLKTESAINPKLSVFKRAYRFVINPVYLVCPKPAELRNTMQYALTGKDTQKVQGPGMGPRGRTVKLDPWQPIYSNSAFIVVMLLMGSFYVYRQDF